MKSHCDATVASGRSRSSSDSNMRGETVSRGRKLERGTQQSRQSSPSTCLSSLIPFAEIYALRKQIDRGTYCVVWEAVHRSSGERYAVKIFDRKKLPTVEEDLAVYNEVTILRYLERRRYVQDLMKDKKRRRRYDIIRLIDFYEEPDSFYLVMELMTGGDIFSRIIERHYYTESEARYLAKHLLESIRYMHESGVVHRDLKPENLLLVKRGNDVHVKIADFGFAAKTRIGGMRIALTQRCGTPAYVAPEVLRGVPYDEAVDMWSLGGILYFVLGGYPPFVDDVPKNLFKKILTADFEFHEQDWSHVSDGAKSLIRGLLTVDPSKRLTAAQALKHPWIRGHAPASKMVKTSSTISTNEVLCDKLNVENYPNFKTGEPSVEC